MNKVEKHSKFNGIDVDVGFDVFPDKVKIDFITRDYQTIHELELTVEDAFYLQNILNYWFRNKNS